MIKKQLINTFSYNTANFIIKLIAFPVIVKSFNIDDYGGYNMIGYIISIATLVFGGELYAYFRKEAPRIETNEQLIFFKSIHLTNLGIVIFIIVLALLFNLNQTLAIFLGKTNYSSIIFYALIIIAPEILIKDIIRFFVSLKKINIANFIMFIDQQLWTLILIILFIIGYKISLLLWIKVYMASTLLSLILALKYLGISDLLSAKFDIRHFYEAVKFGYVILLTVAFTQGSIFFSRYFIVDIISLHAVGIFFFSIKIPGLVEKFSTNIINIVMKPHLIYAANTDNKQRQTELGGKMLVFNIILFLSFTLPLIISLKSIILLIGKEEYLTAPSLIILASISYFIKIFYVSFYTYSFAKGDKKALLNITFYSVFVNLIGMYFLTLYLGLIGSVITLIIKEITFLFSSYLYNRKEKILYIPGRMVKKMLIFIIGTMMISFCIKFCINDLFSNNFIIGKVIIVSSIFFLLTFILLKFLNILTVNIREKKISLNW